MTRFSTKTTPPRLCRKLLALWALALLPLLSWGQTAITPTNTGPQASFTAWSYTDVVDGSGPYYQLLKSTSTIVSPALNLSGYSAATLDFKARTFGGVSNGSNVITVSASTNNGNSWATIVTRTPTTSTLTAVTTISLNAYLGSSSVLVRIQSLAATGSQGVGVDDIAIAGTAATGTPPGVTTDAATATSATTGSVGGNVTSAGTASVTDRGAYYSTTAGQVAASGGTKVSEGGTATGTFTTSLTGLTSNTLYYAAAYATSTAGTGRGSEASFTTLPLVTTSTASANAPAAATASGSVAAGGGASVTDRGVYYSTTGGFSPAAGAGTKAAATTATGTGSFTSNLTGLAANTVYYVVAYATNAGGTSYGTQQSVTTLAGVTSTAGSAPGATTAAPGGTSSGGSATITEQGVYYSTTSGFANGAGTKVASGSTAVGAFTSNLTGLTAGTTYYAKAYVTNAGGTSYGTEVSFTTAGTAPSLTTTAPATGITSGGATLAGNISSFGAPAGSSPAYGFVYSLTSANAAPTLGGAGTTTITAGRAATTGAYSSAVTGLSPSADYSFQAYATNGTGTTYGGVVTFTTAAPPSATLTVSPTSLALGTTGLNTPGPISTYTLSGTGATGPVTITPPTGVEVSTDGFATTTNSSTSALTVAPAAVAAGATVSVRLAAAATAATVSSSVANASGNALTQNVAVSGTVTAGATPCVSEGFSNGTATPSGWTFTDITGTYTSSGNYGAASPSIRFNAATSQVVTPAVSNPQQLSFWLKGQGTDATSTFLVEAYNGATSNWVTVATIGTPPTTGTTFTYAATTDFPAATTQFRFTYVGKTSSNGNLSFDDVAVTCGSAAGTLTVATSPSSPAGPYCVGQGPGGDVAVTVPFTVSNGSFGAGNVFTAYLSNDNFASNRLAIGTVSGVTGGTISATIKQVSGLTTGTYRIRVEGSTTPATYLDNGTNLAVASYLDNEVASATVTFGSGQATLSFTGPANCATNVVVTIKAGSSFGGKPTAGGTYAPGAGSGPVAFGTGTDLGANQYVVYNGPATGSITVTGLANGTRYAFGTFTTNGGPTGTTGYSNGTLRTVVPAAPATLAEVLVPQYLSGHLAGSSSHTTRLPYVWRATLGNLLPNTTYRYYTAVRAATDAATYGGAGIPVETQAAGGFVRGSGPNFGSNSAFTTDASGTYTGWFGLEPTADARFNDQAVVYPMVVLNGGDGGTTATQFLATTSPVTALLLGTAGTGATGVRGASFGTASNFVFTYDNAAGTGRPLAGTWLESDGLTASSYASFYTTSPTRDGTAGAYGLLTPNANANGIQRVEQRALSNGSLVGCAATDADGTWPGGAATANPSGSTLVLTTGDTPFAAPTLTSLSATAIAPGQTLTLTGTGFAASPNATVTFTPGGPVTAATVNTAGTSLTVVVPAGAGDGTVTVGNSCGTSAALATTAIPPSAPGLLLVEDDFDYSGTLVGNGWSGSTGNTTATTSGNVTATAYPRGAALSSAPAGTSYQAQLVSNSSNGVVNRPFTVPPGATTLYAAALLNVTSPQNVSGTDYSFSFQTVGGTVNNRGRITIAKVPNSSPAKFTFGIRAGGESSATTEATPTQFDISTPYVLVMKAENSAATGNTDVYSLYVLPASADLSTEPGTPLLSVTSGNLFSTIGSFGIRQSDANAPSMRLDGFRLATGWGAAVGNPIYTAANSSGSASIAAGNYYSLTLNNGGTLTPDGAVNVEGQLTLTSGNALTSTTNALTLASAASIAGASGSSFVNGPLRRTVPAVSNGSNVYTAYTFPVGKGSAYRPLTLNVNTQGNAITYSAEQVEGNPGQLGTVPSANDGSTLTRVSQIRSYTITPFVGSTVTQPTGFQGTVTLSFGPDDRVTTLSGLVLAKRSDSSQPWVNIGALGGTSSGSGFLAGSLTSGSFSSFSDFALASTAPDRSVNPLPVALTAFAAVRTGADVALTWTTASEKSSAYFEVERSLDGQAFERVARVAAQGSSAQATPYSTRDLGTPAAQLYYRLRQVDQDGTSAYSPTVTVAAGPAGELTLAPNPAHDQVHLLTEQASAYVVRNALGQAVQTGSTAAGSFTTLDVASLPAGVYFFELHGPAGRVVRKLVKE